MDRLESLGIFVAAVEAGSLAAAGRRFGVTPAMAGRHLDALEAKLGTRLLHRTTRRLALTDAGRAYYQRSKRILEEMDEADREAQALDRSPRGTLRVAAPLTFGALHLGPPVARYLAAHPEVAVEIHAGDGYVDLLEQGVDLAIRIGRLADSSLVTRKIAPCRMIACAAPSFLAQHGEPATPADLQRLPRLAFAAAVSPGDWTFVDRRGQAHQVQAPARLEASDMQVLVAAAIAGAGVVYGPSFVLGPAVAAGTLRQVLGGYGSPELTVHAAYPSSRLLSTKVRSFVDQLVADLGSAPWDRLTAPPGAETPQATRTRPARSASAKRSRATGSASSNRSSR